MFSGKPEQIPGGSGGNKGRAAESTFPLAEILRLSPASERWPEVSPKAAGPTVPGAATEARGVLWGQGFPRSKIAFLCPAGLVRCQETLGANQHFPHIQYVTGSRWGISLIPLFPKRLRRNSQIYA